MPIRHKAAVRLFYQVKNPDLLLQIGAFHFLIRETCDYWLSKSCCHCMRWLSPFSGWAAMASNW